jgi:CHAD domain-containing protein
MTTKEKAQELLGKFRMHDIMVTDLMGEELEGYEHRHYKNCALIAVEEILEWTKKPTLKKLTKWEYSGFWLSVKEEIEKL